MNIEALANITVWIIFGIFWIVSFTILYHLTRFGVGTLPKKLSALFLVGAIIIFCISLVLFIKTDFNFILL